MQSLLNNFYTYTTNLTSKFYYVGANIITSFILNMLPVTVNNIFRLFFMFLVYFSRSHKRIDISVFIVFYKFLVFVFTKYYTIIKYYINIFRLFNSYFSWKHSFNMVNLNKFIYVYVLKLFAAICLFIYNFRAFLEVLHDFLYILGEIFNEICTIVSDLYFIFIYPLLMKSTVLYKLDIKLQMFYKQCKLFNKNYLYQIYNFYIYFYLNMLHCIYLIFKTYIYRVYILKQLYIPPFKFSNYFSFYLLRNINTFLNKTNLYSLWYDNIFSFLMCKDNFNHYILLISAYRDIFFTIKHYIKKLFTIKSFFVKA